MKTEKRDMNSQLASAPVLPLLIRLTIPVTVAQLANALYSMVDKMYLGHIPETGTLALSGLGIAFPIIMLISAFSYIPGMGGSPLASIAMGEGNMGKANKCLSNALTMLLVVGISLTVILWIFMSPLLTLFGASKEVLPYAERYLRIYLLGTVFVELSLGLNPFINAQGYTLQGTITIVIGAVLNLILDPLFIYHWDMGIEGAAIATVISQMISTNWVISFLRSPKTTLRIRLCDMKPDKKLIKEICKLGVSPFTFRINESLVVIVLNRLLVRYGGSSSDLHIASLGLLSNMSQVFFMPLTGVITGAQPILSYNLGCGNYSRLKETVKYARGLSMACAILMWAAMMFLPRQICMLFTEDHTLIELTTVTMRMMFCTVFVLGLQMVNQNAFVALGNSFYSFLFGIMRKLLFLIPLALILPMIWGVWGIYAAEAVSNLVTTLITHIVFRSYLEKLIKEGKTT